AHAVVANVTSEDDVQRLINETVDVCDGLDVLVNNAGLGGTARLDEMTDEQWFAVLDVTLNGTMRMTRAALRVMYERGSGAIVNNASVMSWRAQEGQAHYAAAKAGVMVLTRCAAVEAASHNVRVNAVSPSLAVHPFLTKVMSEDLLQELESREAFGRGADPEEVADVIVFLASDLSRYMTGEVVCVSSLPPSPIHTAAAALIECVSETTEQRFGRDAARRSMRARCFVRLVLQQRVYRRRDAVQATEQHDLAVQVVRLDCAGPPLQALPRR